MKEYLTLEEVLAIHQLTLQQYGGSSEVRDLGAIKSALFRPQSGYYSDIIEEAAALTESFLISHPFIDANEQVAFAVCYVFLEINGYLLDANPDWLYGRMMFWIERKEDRLKHIIHDLRMCAKILV